MSFDWLKKLKIPRKYKKKVQFTTRLMAFGLVFYMLWLMSPSFNLLKLFTAHLVSWTTGSEVIISMDGVFLRKGDFLLRIVTDCTAWKEIWVFLSLYFAWPKKKNPLRAIKSLSFILLYNLIRLDFFMFMPKTFNYFHPIFQYFSIILILCLWLFSIGLTKNKLLYALGLKEKKARNTKRKKRKNQRKKRKTKIIKSKKRKIKK